MWVSCPYYSDEYNNKGYKKVLNGV